MGNLDTLADLLAFALVPFFATATAIGARAWIKLPYFRNTIGLLLVVVVTNLVFRVFTMYHRVYDYPFPQPWTTNIALLLQALFAVVAIVIFTSYYRAGKNV